MQATHRTGMRWIPGGEFAMGSDDPQSMANERPAHRVRVDGFWMDEHDVTNGEFDKFVEATGYVTTAERKPEWEEIRRQLPPGSNLGGNVAYCESYRPSARRGTPPDTGSAHVGFRCVQSGSKGE